MEALIFQEVPKKEREQYLRDNATAKENRTYLRSLSAEEVISLQSQFAQKAIELAKAEDELKSHREDFKAKSKPLKLEMQMIMQGIRTSSEEVTEEVYLLADMESQMMGYYNSLGELVYSRPLLASERQFSIVDRSISKIS